MPRRAGFWKHFVRKMQARAIARSGHVDLEECSDYDSSEESKNRKRFQSSSVFDPDFNVFHLMVVLTLVFMALYVFGTSVPSWYVLQEPVTNFTHCTSADYYVTKPEREAREPKETMVYIAASLWFVKIQISDDSGEYLRYMPYISLTQIPSSKGMHRVVMKRWWWRWKWWW